MQNLQEYYEELSNRLDDAEEVDEAYKILDEAHEVSEHCGTIRRVFDTNVPEGFSGAIDADMEHYEGLFLELSQRADSVADDIQAEKDDEEKYGSYQDQVRSQYYGSIL